MELTSTHLRYLHAIYEIAQIEPLVSSADVAHRLGVSRPSVTRMVGVLAEKGLAGKARYGKIVLTPKGELIAFKYEQQIQRATKRIPDMGFALTPSECKVAAAALAGALPPRYFLEVE